ncbi:hypothetical protein NPIL_301241 [Nephila pilipes]|uniref:Uncharacterized protein n=1 Tax=Nephila pilipes TaxID=299642 RepID=A0A8X6QRZ3_NEPPI|nr:hypothetical protein NPIL_301241 [Nephila pilipes]
MANGAFASIIENRVKLLKQTLLRIDDSMYYPAGARSFSMMDLKSGYWPKEVVEIDQDKTVFVASDDIYEFNSMPFEVCSALAIHLNGR